MSFSAFFGIFVLDKNNIFENAFGELVKKLEARCIVVVIGVDVDSNILTIGPHIYEWGAQFLELGGVILKSSSMIMRLASWSVRRS